MFQFTTSILTCLAMLWHSVGGCCWHHETAECAAAATVTTQSTSHDHACSHHHRADSPASNEDSSAPFHKDHECDGQSCVYVKSPALDVDRVFDAALSDLVALDVPLCCSEAPLRAQCEFDLDDPLALSALSRCALTQSWQI